MSKKLKATVPCPDCNRPFAAEIFRSIWIEYPDNRELIFSDKINIITCPYCKSNTKVDMPFLCTNVKRGIAIWYEPHHDKDIDRDLVEYAKRFGANSFYAKAPRIRDWQEFKNKIVEMERGTENTNPSKIMTPEMQKEFSGFLNVLDKMTRAAKPFKVLLPAFAIVVALSLLALFKMPYGYYTFLRIVVFSCGIATAVIGFKAKETAIWAWTAVAIAILFNPIISVHLDREVWRVFNVGVAAFFGTLAYKNR